MNSPSVVSTPQPNRSFIPNDFKITTWEALAPYFEQVFDLPLDSPSALDSFLAQRNELEAVVIEDMAWRYIRKTCDTQNEAHREAYQYFIQHIFPELSRYENKLNKKLAASPYFKELPDQPYLTYTRRIQRELELFREENIALEEQQQQLAQRFMEITGPMTITFQGETLTMQQAGKWLEDTDRTKRQEVWTLMQATRKTAWESLSDIFDQLVKLRTQIAQHAGYDTYTQYKFDELGRFDYQPTDTSQFHAAVEAVVTPIYQELLKERKEVLGVEVLKPWDVQVDIFGNTPLQPFEEAQQLADRTIIGLSRLKPELGAMIQLMNDKGFLDLASRAGKAPGGYNYPLAETGIPFIFMNAAGTHTDVTTMFHESGHAIHSFLTQEIELNALKNMPSEVAELAAMTMELLTLDQYDLFYPDTQAFKRAQKTQLMRCITVFPWVATVDAFQQWVYDHPTASSDERHAQWTAIYHRFHGDMVDFSGYESELSRLWLKQMHIFEVPFYYIEYAIAQLGALAVWKNFQANPEQGLNQYLAALSLGYTRTIPEIYVAAGIKFDFGADYISELVTYCMEAYQAIKLDESLD